MALCGAIFLYLEKRLKNVKHERKQYICQPFLANFQGNVENVRGAMWRYVALFFCTSKIALKTSKMKGNNSYANFFWPIFKETWKTFVALCGAIFLYLEKRLKNVKHERKQYICQPFLANFQGNLENVRGAMWRYFFVPRKTAKKRQKWKETIHMPTFFGQFSRKPGKRSWRYVALFFCTLKNG